MATSGSFYTTEANTQFGIYKLLCEWNLDSQDSVENTSTISWKVTLESSSGYPCLFTSGSVSIDGTTVFQRGGGLVADEAVVASGSTTLEHEPNGKKTFVFKVDGASDYFSVTISGSETITLPSMKRASEITFASDVVLGNSCSIKWTPASYYYKYKLRFTLGEFSHETDFISPKRTYAYTYNKYTIPDEVAEQITDSRTASMAVVLSTYSSTDDFIDSYSSSFNVTVPERMKPVVQMTVSPVNAVAPLADISSIYIQGKSKARVSFEGTQTLHNASIASYVFYINTSRYEFTEAQGDSDTVTDFGTINVRGVVTDSRGLSSEVTESIEVLPYALPSIVPYSGNKIVCERSEDNKIFIQAGREYSRLEIDGVQNNFCPLSFRYAQSGASLPEQWTVILPADSEEDKVSYLGGVTLDEKTSYTIQLKAEDELGGIKIISFAVSTAEATFHLKPGGKGAAFGKYAENDDMLDVAWDIQARKSINGAFISCFNVSTTTFSLSMTGGAQNVLMFGKEVLGVLEYNGTSTVWNGSSGTSCSTSGGIVTVTVPNTGGFVAISDNIFEIS